MLRWWTHGSLLLESPLRRYDTSVTASCVNTPRRDHAADDTGEEREDTSARIVRCGDIRIHAVSVWRERLRAGPVLSV